MLIFVDESGDPGINSRNELFVLGLVRFDDRRDAQTIDRNIGDLTRRLRMRGEFHFTECPTPLKEKFFDCIASRKFAINCVIVHKPSIRNKHLRENPRRFYDYFLRRLLEKSGVTNAKIVIDGQGQPAFIRSLKHYLNKHVSSQILELQLKHSHRDNLLQLADMVVGAIARAHTSTPNKTARWLEMLELKEDEIWHF